MSKAKLSIEIEIDVSPNEKYDSGLSEYGVAENACGGLHHCIKEAVKKHSRESKVTKASYHYEINKTLLWDEEK